MGFSWAPLTPSEMQAEHALITGASQLSGSVLQHQPVHARCLSMVRSGHLPPQAGRPPFWRRLDHNMLCLLHAPPVAMNPMVQASS